MSRSKRLLDVAGSVVALIITAPILLLAALAVRVNMGAPVLFRQPRPGLHGKIFTLVKLRTMADIRSESGELLPDSQRMTSLGRFLRRFSVDEIPQLWNVLMGDLSLVGPRPLLVRYLDRYTAEEKRRHDVKPGITGWAQLNGRNAIAWEEKFQLDLWYVDNWSLWLDMKILAGTLALVLSGKGVTQEGESTVGEFKRTRNGTSGGASHSHRSTGDLHQA